jgi:hypothetical protein
MPSELLIQGQRGGENPCKDGTKNNDGIAATSEISNQKILDSEMRMNIMGSN